MIYLSEGYNTFRLRMDVDSDTNNQYVMRLKNHVTRDIKDFRIKNSSQFVVDNLIISDEVQVCTGNTFVTGNTSTGYTHITELNIDVLNYTQYEYNDQYTIYGLCEVSNDSYLIVYDKYNSSVTSTCLLTSNYCYNFNFGKFINDYFIVTYYDSLNYKYKARKFRILNDGYGIKYANVWQSVFEVDFNFSDFHKIENTEIIRLYYENEEYNSVYVDFTLTLDNYQVDVSEFTIDYCTLSEEDVYNSKVFLKEYEGHNDFFIYDNPDELELGELKYRGLVFINPPTIIYTTNTKDLKLKVKNYEE